MGVGSRLATVTRFTAVFDAGLAIVQFDRGADPAGRIDTKRHSDETGFLR